MASSVRRAPLGLGLGLLLTAACHGTPAAPPEASVIVRPIHVDSVEVVLDAAPAAHVRGIVGDGCTELQGVTQARTGSAIEITILSRRPADAICTQLAKLYDALLPLAGPFPSGSYVVTVNGVAAPFAVP
jgi:hypothetical protein